MATRDDRIIAVTVPGISLGLLIGPPQPMAAGEADEATAAERSYQRWSRVRQLRPRRPTVPLRETKISDNEVRQIEQAPKAVFPTEIVNISGVTTGCPCEDGPDRAWE